MIKLDMCAIRAHIRGNPDYINIKIDKKPYCIGLLWQKTGFGYKPFLACPTCGKRRTALYLRENKLRCRSCLPFSIYKGIQNPPKGGDDAIGYKMLRYAKKKGITFSFPFDYKQFLLDPRTLKDSFTSSLIVLQGLENMRFCAIFFKTRFNSKIIKSVLDGNHPHLKNYTLEQLATNLYNW